MLTVWVYHGMTANINTIQASSSHDCPRIQPASRLNTAGAYDCYAHRRHMQGSVWITASRKIRAKLFCAQRSTRKEKRACPRANRVRCARVACASCILAWRELSRMIKHRTPVYPAPSNLHRGHNSITRIMIVCTFAPCWRSLGGGDGAQN